LARYISHGLADSDSTAMAVAFAKCRSNNLKGEKTKMAETDSIHVSEDSHIPNCKPTARVEEISRPAGKFHFVIYLSRKPKRDKIELILKSLNTFLLESNNR
jgi:hypothetical protein